MFFKYNRVRLQADLMGGATAVADVSFVAGSNVIVTDSNTQGKSSLINSLAIGMGFDDLAKGSVSALVNDAIKINGEEVPVFGAEIFLEIENSKGQVISLKRSLRPEISKLIFVNSGSLSSWKDEGAGEYYVGLGSYQDTRGFHRFLSEFIEFPDIKVVSYDEAEMRLYMEYLFSAIFIEQKRGWSDIMANAPYYRVKDPKKSTISEILGMDYIKNNLQRNILKIETDKLKAEYEGHLTLLKQQLHARHFHLRGLPDDITAEVWSPTVYRSFEGQEDTTLSEITEVRRAALSELEEKYVPQSSDRRLKSQLESISKQISILVSRKNELNFASSIYESSIRRFKGRVSTLDSDLKKNKEEQKIRDLLHTEKWVVKKHCPACEQPIDESLLSQLKSFPTMSLDENIKYISDQRGIVTEVLAIEGERQQKVDSEVNLISTQLEELLKQQSDIQRSLSGAVPSELMAQARQIAHLEQEVSALEELQELSNSAFGRIKEIFDEYHSKARTLAGLKTGLIQSDVILLNKFQTIFKKYLESLGFNSYEIGSVVIDHDTFLPKVIVQNIEDRKRVRAEFGSSASDWIRIIIAYTLALHTASKNSSKNNHPQVSVFDEPAQQKMNDEDHLKFYDLVSEVCKGGGQIIIAASDQDKKVRKRAQELKMNVIDFGANLVMQPLDEVDPLS